MNREVTLECPYCNVHPCRCHIPPPACVPPAAPRPDPSRAEIALAVLLKLCDQPRSAEYLDRREVTARIAVDQADALLDALKGGG
jgi:hypothetical protein